MRTHPTLAALLITAPLITAPLLTAPLLVTAHAAPAAVGDAAAVPRLCDGLRATITGTDGPDRLVGTPGDDVIVGGDGDDVIDGRGGDDVICGNAGADVLLGGAGDDRLLGGTDRYVGGRTPATFGDLLDGGAGDDVLRPGRDPRTDTGPAGFQALWELDRIRFAGAPGGVRVDLGAGSARGHGTDRIQGSLVAVSGTRFDDVLLAGDTSAALMGGGGDDRLVGGPERDLLVTDALSLGGPTAPSGDDTVVGGAGDDEVYSAAGRDDIMTGAGRDRVDVDGGRATKVDVGRGNDSVDLGDVTSYDGFEVRFADRTTDRGDLLVLDLRSFTGSTPFTWDMASGAATDPDGGEAVLLGVASALVYAPGVDLVVTGTDGVDSLQAPEGTSRQSTTSGISSAATAASSMAAASTPKPMV